MKFMPNFNYLDPGTGSYILQILAAAGITVGIYFKSVKTYLLSLKEKFFKNKS